MTVAYLDTIALVAALCALYFVLRFSTNLFGRSIKGLFLAFVILNMGRNLSNTLEQWGITASVAPFKNYFEILIPIVWSLAIFSYAQRIRERELVNERTNFQAFFDAISDLAFVLSKKMEIIHVNPAAQSRLGYSFGELTRKNIRDLLAKDNSDAVHCESARIQVTGVSYIECAMQTKSGAVIPVEMKLSRGAWNGVEAVFCVSRDITERQTMESRLRQAEKMDIIGQMAGGIAHDFNNQLLGIMGYADVLVHALKADPKNQSYVKNLLVSAKHAAELTRRLLEFARKGAGRLKVVDLHRLIVEVSTMLSHSIDKRIAIEHQLKAKRRTTMGDPTQIQSAVLNIALNARDAMIEGGELIFSTDEVRLDASQCRSLLCDVQPGDYIRLQVCDTGIGMSKAVMDRIFEPFFTTKEKGRGTGLGMAAVYSAIKNHKGSIEVQSKESRGTTVTLYFPTAEEQAASEPEAFLLQKSDDACRILLVDDEDIVRQVTTDLLSDMGYAVASCKNGREAVEYYRLHSNEIDIIILDMVMPEMDGKTAFLKIREINPDVKVIISSGHTVDSITQELIDMGHCSFLIKPYRSLELSEKVYAVRRGAK